MEDFSNWSRERRLALRRELDAIGADERTEYQTAGVVVAVPRGCEPLVRQIANRHGLAWAKDWQFPLGAVNGIPHNLRCDCWTYGGERNVWHFALLSPTPPGAGEEKLNTG